MVTGTADAAEVLEQKALAMEERSRSLAPKNESLQARLDAALKKIEVNDQSLQPRIARCSERERERERERETGVRGEPRAE